MEAALVNIMAIFSICLSLYLVSAPRHEEHAYLFLLRHNRAWVITRSRLLIYSLPKTRRRKRINNVRRFSIATRFTAFHCLNYSDRLHKALLACRDDHRPLLFGQPLCGSLVSSQDDA